MAAALCSFRLRMWNATAAFLRTGERSGWRTVELRRHLDGLAPYQDGPVHFLIFAASRNESGHVDDDEMTERVFGRPEPVLNLPHNTYEQLGIGSVIIRKSSVRLMPGELSVLPSHMSGDAVLIRANDRVGEILNSMSHGTGWKNGTGDCKPFADAYDYEALRKLILIPAGVDNASLRTDGPFAYRDLPSNSAAR